MVIDIPIMVALLLASIANILSIIGGAGAQYPWMWWTLPFAITYVVLFVLNLVFNWVPILRK